MVRQGKKRLIPLLAFAFAATIFPLRAQQNSERQDSLVRLMKAESLQLIEKNGLNYRKAIDATFLHNGTYLICDTALWHVEDKIINAFGNVQIIQDETKLTGDKLDYIVDEDLAKFRGTLVQLQDKDHNVLRTRHLDYNTKDSVAVFKNGGALLANDGQIIESIDGSYSSPGKRFVFTKDVNMFADSIFVKTSSLIYETDPNKATFNSQVDFWKEGNMLSADGGWYDRPKEIFFFRGNVHGTTKDQEAWSDSLFYYRKVNDILMLGNAQVQDTSRSIDAVADHIFYKDSLSKITLCKRAAVAMQTKEKEKTDTIYFGADTLIYNTVRMCDVPQAQIDEAKSRLADMMVDPVTEYRRKAAQEAAEAAEKAAKEKEENMRGPKPARHKDRKPEAAEDKAKPEEESKKKEEEEAPAEKVEVADTLKTLAPPDTTKTGFLLGRGRVRAFRRDIQMLCDSMRYCDLDSIARFYKDPIIWNEGNRQYASDSIHILVRDSRMDRVSLMGRAFITTEEAPECYNQIKGTEVMAYFDTTGALKRFDSMGGASALFYLEENDALATVNKVESKMLSAVFKDGDIDRVYYFDTPKNDAYPVAQLPRAERKLKEFNWQPDLRPQGKEDITTLEVKPSERSTYAKHPKASFTQMETYFPGHMAELYKAVERSDSLKRLPKPKPSESAVPDTVKTASDTTAASVKPVEENLEQKDTSSVEGKKVGTDAQTEVRSEKESGREKRLAEKKARWDELDRQDSLKREAKALKALEKKRELTRKAVLAQRAQDAKDQKKLERYMARYEKKKARQDAAKARRVEKKAKRKKTQDTITEDNGTDSEQISTVRGD